MWSQWAGGIIPLKDSAGFLFVHLRPLLAHVAQPIQRLSESRRTAMARKDDPEPADDFEDDTPATKKGFPVWGWFLFAAAILVIVCGGGSIAMALMFWTGARVITAPTTMTPDTLPGKVEATVYMREDFRKLVLGKTPAEVIAAVGRPDSTGDISGVGAMWYYKNRTKDSVSGKLDTSAQIVFSNGVASHVNY